MLGLRWNLVSEHDPEANFYYGEPTFPGRVCDG